MKRLISFVDSTAKTAPRSRNRSLSNLSRMGHCAPAVMQTLLDLSALRATWLVRMVAGLPGGIGNTGQECGGITAPLILLGLQHTSDPMRGGVPMIVYKGHDFLQRFESSCGAIRCSRIRGQSRLPLKCIRVILQASELFEKTLSSDCADALSPERCEAYGRLNAYYAEQGFHCAHAVFYRLRDSIPVNQELLDGTSGFMGGTVFTGRSCSAFVAGVMALGLALGDIENSRLRVLRMIGTMAVGGDAFADNLNAFNRTMNRGHRLGQWFAARFGSTRCSAIANSDFSRIDGVVHYIEKDGVTRCAAMAQDVADEVLSMIRHARDGQP